MSRQMDGYALDVIKCWKA